MRNRQGSQRGDWRSEDDWRREREERERRDRGEWRPEGRYARGGEGGEGPRGGYDDLTWRDDEREATGYGRPDGQRAGYGGPGYGNAGYQGYQGRRDWSSGPSGWTGDDYSSQGYNLGTNYGQGGPQGQGFGQGSSSYGRQGYAGGRTYGQGPREAGFGGFGNPGYRGGEGSWREGRWESDVQGANEPYDPFYQPPGRGQGRWDRGERWDRAVRPARVEWPEDTRRGRAAYVTGREELRVRPPRGYVRSDERIREDICDAIVMEAIDAGDVDVVVVSGEVTLSGSVEDKQDKRRLEDIAEQVPGVRTVNNQLRVGAAAQQNQGAITQSGQLDTGQNALAGGGKNAGSTPTRTS
jgi:hypothetical protein